ncbi:MAG: histidine kinase [Oscillospiraceae bacterium]|nr:histidine kinase [Oscillospiraceae bacterium]MDD4368051.1 histidine kinase [Oscillospiraceae bacterium]
MSVKILHRFRSIRTLIFSVCILSLLIMQLVLFMYYSRSKTMIVRNNRSNFQGLIEQMNESVQLNCSYLNGMVENIAYSRSVQSYLELDNATAIQNDHAAILNFIKPFAEIQSGIRDIAVIGLYGNVVNINLEEDVVRTIAQEIPEKTLWYYTGLHKMTINHHEDWLFTVGANVYSTTDFTNKAKIGTVLITFNMQSIFGFSRYQANDQYPEMLIFDRNQTLAYQNVAEGTSTDYSLYFNQAGNYLQTVQTFNGQTYYIETGSFDTLGGHIVFLITADELVQGLESTKRWTQAACLIALAIMLLLTFLSSNDIIRPIRQFVSYLNGVRQGDLRLLKVPIHLNGASELVLLADEFNRMMNELNDMNHRLVQTSMQLYESELAQKQAELNALYSQINPHFLFNTLEAIKGSAVDENAHDTFIMLTDLARLFRYAVREDKLVRLSAELDVISSYLALQKMRFGNELKYEYQIEPELLGQQIPKLLLQPLVENAVLHGMEQNGSVMIWLTGHRKGDKVLLEVRDNGAGIDEKRRQEIMRQLRQHRGNQHLGLYNTYNRLTNLYGKKGGLVIRQMQGQGFAVDIYLPWQPTPSAEA